MAAVKYTPEEIAELLKERPNQPHYIASLVRRAVKAAVETEREACAQIAEDPKSGLSAWRTRERIAEAIRARSER